MNCASGPLGLTAAAVRAGAGAADAVTAGARRAKSFQAMVPPDHVGGRIPGIGGRTAQNPCPVEEGAGVLVHRTGRAQDEATPPARPGTDRPARASGSSTR